MKKLFLFLIFIFISSFLFSQIIVDYVEGFVDVKYGDDWLEIWIGEILEPDSLIRVGNGSYIELSNNESRIKISNEGLYLLSNLLNASVERRSIVSSLTNRVRALALEPRQETQTAAAGVRADHPETAGVSWAEDTSSSLMEDGIYEFESGNFEDAIELFNDALYIAEDEEDMEASQYVHLLLGISFIETGNLEEAYNNLNKSIEINPDSEEADIAREFLQEDLNGN